MSLWPVGGAVALRRRASLKLPQLRELREHGVGVDERQRQPDPAIEESATQDEISEKSGGWMDEKIERPRPASGFVHLPRREGRVVIDSIQVVVQVAVGVVLNLLVEPADRAVRGHRLVHVLAAPARRASVVQPGLRIGVEVGRPQPPARGETSLGLFGRQERRVRPPAAPESPPRARVSLVRRRRARKSSRGMRARPRSSSDRRIPTIRG